MIRCPFSIRPRDFDTLDSFADFNPELAELAEELAWGEDGKFSWRLFFGFLRDSMARYATA